MMLVPHHFRDRRVAVLGCGYVGLTLATAMADVGFDVLGVEIRDDVLALLREGRPHFHEPGLEPVIQKAMGQGRLRFVKTLPEDHEADVFIITVGTPLDASGRARLDMIDNIVREVAARMGPNALVVMRSTVKLGTTRSLVIPVLDATGVPYEIAFCPERTLEGQALAELRSLPQIVGGGTLEAAIRASQLFQFLTPTTVRVSSLETAEMIKLVDNAQRDVHFAFSNEVARLCDSIAVSAAEVIRAGKLGYPRTNLAMPGPVGGPCLSKDPYILAESFEGRSLVPAIAMASRRTNEDQPAEASRIMRELYRRVSGGKAPRRISLLGLAFKGRPETDDLRGTMAAPILQALRGDFPGADIRGWDAVVAPEAISDFGLPPAASLRDAFAGADLVVIANNHRVFEAMSLHDLAGGMATPGLVYDFWNNFETGRVEMPAGRHYAGLGSAGVLAADLSD